MSYYDYRISFKLAEHDHPFYALIMAAMRQADTLNAKILKESFPRVWAELEARYHAPGGLLDGDDL